MKIGYLRTTDWDKANFYLPDYIAEVSSRNLGISWYFPINEEKIPSVRIGRGLSELVKAIVISSEERTGKQPSSLTINATCPI